MRKNTYSTRDDIHSGTTTPTETTSALVGAIVGTLVGAILIAVGVLGLNKSKGVSGSTSNSQEDGLSPDKCSPRTGIIFIAAGVIVSVSCWLWWSVARKMKE